MPRMIVEVVGMKAFQGSVDGSAINSGTLYTRVKLDQRFNKEDATSKNFKAGEAVEEWKLPTADHVLRMKHLANSMPFTAELEVERVSNGKESKEIVVDVIPQQAASPVPQQLRKAA
jgi:hypothetical protein